MISNYYRSAKNVPRELDSILDAVLTVSPKRQYLGMVCPTTPVQNNVRKLSNSFKGEPKNVVQKTNHAK